MLVKYAIQSRTSVGSSFVFTATIGYWLLVIGYWLFIEALPQTPHTPAGGLHPDVSIGTKQKGQGCRKINFSFLFILSAAG
jgi:hypothetical protein